MAPLLLAIQKNDPLEVASALEMDDAAAFLPLKGYSCGWQIPTALKYGCSVEIIRMLCMNGADPNATDNRGIAPLAAAVGADGHDSCENIQSNFMSFPRMDLGQHVPLPLSIPGIQDISEFRSMHWDPKSEQGTSESKTYETVQCLLSLGADPSWKGKDGLTAADIARKHGMLKVADLISHWNGQIVQHVLIKHWGSALRDRACETQSGGGSPSCESCHTIADLPAPVCQILFEFLVVGNKIQLNGSGGFETYPPH